MKSATTSLHDHLASSPGTAPARIKEVHYFDRESFGEGEGWYRSFFGLRILKRGRRSFESTPGYIESDVARRRLATDLPQAKLVVVLRSPAERARSHYLYNLRRGVEHRSFRMAVEDEVVRFHGSRSGSVGEGRTESALDDRFRGRGLYADRLQALLDLGVRRPVLILFMESLIADPGPSLRLLHEFVEIPPPPPVTLPRLNSRGLVTESLEPDDALVLEELRDFFLPENQRLRELIRSRPDDLVALPEQTWPSWVSGETERG